MDNKESRMIETAEDVCIVSIMTAADDEFKRQ